MMEHTPVILAIALSFMLGCCIGAYHAGAVVVKLLKEMIEQVDRERRADG